MRIEPVEIILALEEERINATYAGDEESRERERGIYKHTLAIPK